VEKIIGSERTKEAIVKALEQVCSLIPGDLRSTCDIILEVYLPEIIDLLLAKESPEVICKQIRMCLAEVPHHRSNSFECTVCKLVMAEVEKIIASNYTRARIEDALAKVCEILPQALQEPCKGIVSQYLPELIELFLDRESPDTICKQIKLCQSNVVRSPMAAPMKRGVEKKMCSLPIHREHDG